MSEEQCPNLKNNIFCRETERPSGRIKVCHLVSGNECEEWEEIKKEWETE